MKYVSRQSDMTLLNHIDPVMHTITSRRQFFHVSLYPSGTLPLGHRMISKCFGHYGTPHPIFRVRLIFVAAARTIGLC